MVLHASQVGDLTNGVMKHTIANLRSRKLLAVKDDIHFGGRITFLKVSKQLL